MTGITKGRTYRHRNCIDVDMHVMAIKYMGDSYFKLKVVFVNRHNGMLYEPDKVTLQYRDLKNWELVG